MNALIVVDMQNDFLPPGPLEVPQANGIVPVINRLMAAFPLVVATQDWHPRNHCSFADNYEGKEPLEVIEVDGLEQTLWPVHCVQETPGAELLGDLETREIDRVFPKGSDPEVDSYSGFFDNGRRKDTGLHEFLRAKGVETLYITGVATNVCVRATALDACDLGYETFVVRDAIRGVDVEEGAVRKAIEEMAEAGAKLVSADEALERIRSGA